MNYRLNNIKILGKKEFIPPIKKTQKLKKLKGSASQIRRLIMILPSAIADCIKDEQDNVWKMYLSLRELCSLVCAPALSLGQVAQLETSIEDYLQLRILCFPNEKLRPKHEYVYHYPALMEHFGPLEHLWTLRFESKHAYFKNIIRRVMNFKNVDYTLAEKHELMQCTLTNQYYDVVTLVKPVEWTSLNLAHGILSKITTFCEDNSVVLKHACAKASFRGVEYARNMTLYWQK